MPEAQQPAQSAQQHTNTGVEYTRNREFDKAIESFNAAISLLRNNAPAYYYRGAAYHHKGEYAKAIDDYNAALRIWPEYVDAYNNRGYTFAALQEWDKALADYDDAIRYNKNKSLHSVYNNRGCLYRDRGGEKRDYAKAIADFNKAIALKPNYENAHYNLALTYYQLNRSGEALESLNRAIELNKNAADAYYYRSALHLRHDKGEAALEDFKKAEELGSGLLLTDPESIIRALSLKRERIFISYSHMEPDRAWRDKLRLVLRLLERKDLYIWDDTDIKATQEWDEEIKKAMSRTNVAVCLVSSNFLSSEYILKNELPYLLDARKQGNLKLTWLLLEECNYEKAGLHYNQAAHDLKKPLNQVQAAEELVTFINIALKIKAAIEAE